MPNEIHSPTAGAPFVPIPEQQHSILPAGQPFVGNHTPPPPQQPDDSNLPPPVSYTPLRIPPPNALLPSMEGLALSDILEPSENDVLCGRGGGTNNHVGNQKFRELVDSQKVLYLNSSKRDKPLVSRGIVRAVRNQNPPGRFLQKDESTGFYYDIGDAKAREKTSQALREGAPEIRNQISTSDEQEFRDAMRAAVNANPFWIPSSKPNKRSAASALRPVRTPMLARPPNVPPPAPKARFHHGTFSYAMNYPHHTSTPASNNSPKLVSSRPNGDHAPFGSPDHHHQQQMYAADPSPYGRAPIPAGSFRPQMPHGGALHHHQTPMSSYPPPPNNAGPRSYRHEFAEVIAQNTAAETMTDELHTMDRRVSLYLDAGILGIPPAEIVKRLANGETEFDIIEQAYLQLKQGREASSKKRKGRGKQSSPTEEEPKKKSKPSEEESNGPALSEAHIAEALIMVRGSA